MAIRDEKGNWYVAFFELLFLRGWKFNMAHGDQIALCMKWWQPRIKAAEALLAQEKGVERRSKTMNGKPRSRRFRRRYSHDKARNVRLEAARANPKAGAG